MPPARAPVGLLSVSRAGRPALPTRNTELLGAHLGPHLGLFSLARVTQSRSPSTFGFPHVCGSQSPKCLSSSAPTLQSRTPITCPTALVHNPGHFPTRGPCTPTCRRVRQSPHRPWRHVPLQAAHVSPLPCQASFAPWGPCTLPTALRPPPHHWARRRPSPSVLH